MKNLKTILGVILIMICFVGNGQNKTVDSLKQELKTANHDTIKLRILDEMIEAENDDKVWTVYNNEMKSIAEKLISGKPDKLILQTAKKHLASSFNNIGGIYYIQGDLPKALEYYGKSLKIKEEIGVKSGMAISIINIGAIYFYQGDLTKALEYYDKSIKIFEEIGDKKGMASSFICIGGVYDNQGDISKALEYYSKSIKIFEEFGDKKGMAVSFNNIGTIYENQGDIPKALEYYNKSLKLREEIGDKNGMATSFNNIGMNYKAQGDISKALEYYGKCLKIREEIGDKSGMDISLYNIGKIYLKQNNIAEANNYAEKSYKLSKELGYPQNIKCAASLLKKINEKQGNYKKAFEYFQEEILMRDSINNEENYKQTQKQQAKYEYEKRAATDSISNAKAMEIKNIELSRSEEIKKKQTVVIYSFIIGFIIIIIFSFIIFRLFIQKKKANILLSQQKEEISAQRDEIEAQRDNLEVLNEEISTQRDTVTEQKEHIEEIHKDLTDSINYAERIQRSFLATKEILTENLHEHFVFFKPKDVVSGDFYWANKLKNGNFVLATADSTGHGVPGAIMSILNISSLEKAIEQGLCEPSEILNHTRKTIIERLKKDGSSEGGKDGMDASLICFDFANNKFTYSAANNPIWVIRENQLIELNPDKMPVGKHDKDQISFTQQEFQLQKGDILYTLTDGLPDQFGGPKGKKFKYAQLKELLLSIHSKTMLEQKQILENTLHNWKGDLEQVDDISIVGLKI